MRTILSIDVESDGLYGMPFAIGSVVYQDGKRVAEYFSRLPNNKVSEQWVIDNVLPILGSESDDKYGVTHNYLDAMLAHFNEWWNNWKAGAEVVCHMGVPVESNLFRLLNQAGFMGSFDGPYPLIDVSTALFLAGCDPASVDDYAEINGIAFKGNPHNPLYDAEVVALVWMDLTKYFMNK